MTFLLRKPRRLSITVSGHVYQRLLDISDQQGRSLSNYAAYVLEAALGRSGSSDTGSDLPNLSACLVDRSSALQPQPVFLQQPSRGLNPNAIAKAKQPVA